jgi:hypothetical protein
MKLITYFLLLTSLLYSRITFSYPDKGDYVKFEAAFENDVILFEKKILSQNLENETFEVHSYFTFKGQTFREQRLIFPRTFLFTPEKIEHVLQTCVRREGALGEVIIKNKKIKVCEYYNEDSQLTEIVGSVPFGQIRFQIYLEGETFLDFHLKEFEQGKNF